MMDRVDALFCVLASIAMTAALGSAVTLIVLAQAHNEKKRPILIAAALEIVLVLGGVLLAWSGITGTMVRFGAEGMAPLLIGPAVRMCAPLAFAVTVANVAAALSLRAPKA